MNDDLGGQHFTIKPREKILGFSKLLQTSLMAEETAPKLVPAKLEPKPENPQPTEDSENAGVKRAREEDEAPKQNGDKKVKIEDEEHRLESSGDGYYKMGVKEEKESGGATVGPKTFGSSVEMLDYFFKLLHHWSPNINLNKYEHTMMLKLLEKGHPEAERKMGKGIKAFQVRVHPQYKARCFFLIREDGTTDDFSYRKCVHHILPLPENMPIKHGIKKQLRGGGGNRGRGGGRGRGCK